MNCAESIVVSEVVWYVVVCIDLSVKEPHRELGLDRVVTSGSLSVVMVGTLARNPGDMGSILTLGGPFPIFIIHMPVASILISCWLGENKATAQW